MYYAQIDSDGICRAITETHRAIQGINLIPIAFFDESLLGKKWTGDTWEDMPIEPVEPQPDRITQLEQVVDTLLTGGETL